MSLQYQDTLFMHSYGRVNGCAFAMITDSMGSEVTYIGIFRRDEASDRKQAHCSAAARIAAPFASEIHYVDISNVSDGF